jgi:hypothetical protein
LAARAGLARTAFLSSSNVAQFLRQHFVQHLVEKVPKNPLTFSFTGCIIKVQKKEREVNKMKKSYCVRFECADGTVGFFSGKKIPKIERLTIEKEHGKILYMTVQTI